MSDERKPPESESRNVARERTKAWREKNRDKYNAYMRDYMRKKRG